MRNERERDEECSKGGRPGEGIRGVKKGGGKGRHRSVSTTTVLSTRRTELLPAGQLSPTCGGSLADPLT